MFGILLFAHLLGDYPLQTNWIVKAKRTWVGLTLHVTLHFLVLLILVGPARRVLLPYLLLLTTSHFAVDTLKTLAGQLWPRQVNGPYLLDQLLHVLFMVLIAAWIQARVPEADVPTAAPWMRYATALLFATYVWFVSERVLTHNNPTYQLEVAAQKWPRMATRAVLLAIFLGIFYLFGDNAQAVQALSGQPAILPVTALAPLPLSMPYLSGQYRRRALLTDLTVTLVTALILHGA